MAGTEPVTLPDRLNDHRFGAVEVRRHIGMLHYRPYRRRWSDAPATPLKRLPQRRPTVFLSRLNDD